jgi:hypothetical protein
MKTMKMLQIYFLRSFSSSPEACKILYANAFNSRCNVIFNCPAFLFHKCNKKLKADEIQHRI